MSTAAGRSPLFRSLRVRMALSHGAVLAAIVVILGGIGYLLLARNVDRQATSDLTQAAAEQVDRIQEAGRPVPAPDSDAPSASSTLVAVVRGDGSIVGERSDVPGWLRPRGDAVTDMTVAGEPVRLVTVRARGGAEGPVWVVAGRSLEPEEDLVERVRLLLLGGGVLAVVMGMLAGWVLAGRALRPVRRAYEAQANFAADASHEFRTPLAFVRSGVEVLAERDPELGGEVLSEVDYLSGLTDRLLTLARADNASLALESTPVHLLRVAGSSVQRVEHVHGVAVHVRPAPSGGDVALGDAVVIEAVLDAILENVARHGGGAADLIVSRTDGHVRLAIADHGPGLRPDERAAAFERFYRADPSRAREAGGAGLGLAVAQELVSAQRGRMWLEETPGGGVTAVVELPGDPGGLRSRRTGVETQADGLAPRDRAGTGRTGE